MSGICGVLPGERSSRTSAAAAWGDGPPAGAAPEWKRLLADRVDPRWTNFSWISPATLLDSINDKIVKGVDDVIDVQRMRWVSAR
jgi:hypothetical protein